MQKRDDLVVEIIVSRAYMFIQMNQNSEGRTNFQHLHVYSLEASKPLLTKNSGLNPYLFVDISLTFL
jgi:hypothetical protein